MKYLSVVGALIAQTLLLFFTAQPASAISNNVVISQIQLGASGVSKSEYIELYNRSTDEVNVVDWCVTYSDYNDASQSILHCLAAPDGVDELRIPGNGYALIISQSYTPATDLVFDGKFNAASTDMSGARGHIRLINQQKQEVDKVAWDNKASTPPLHPETLAAIAPATGKSLQRKGTPLIDTDNNSLDFSEQVSSPHSSQVYEYTAPPPVIDICQLEGIQVTMPDGYDYDEAGNCERISSDLCLNVAKIQLELPDTMLQDTAKNCYQDVCANIPELQIQIPIGYIQFERTCTKIEDRTILITEVLPNVDGSDTGKEYVELYNPNEDPVNLDGYVLHIGKQFEKSISLEPFELSAKGYVVFYDNVLNFTLLNTSSGVQISAPSGRIVSETSYSDPGDDTAWAFIDDQWQYTNRPTPAAQNQASLLVEDEDPLSPAGSVLAACPSGKYRSPITNRCRNIEMDAVVLASCDADEYRNPDTNRCRKISTLGTSSLAACEDGYVRNTETNRCRKVLSAATTSTSCQEGYERNPETNRCRKVQAKQTNGFSPKTQSGSSFDVWAIGGIASVAIGYGVYEWRRELLSGVLWVVAKAKSVL